MSMDHIPNEEHNFGPKDGKQLMHHIATALALKGLSRAADNRATQGTTKVNSSSRRLTSINRVMKAWGLGSLG